MLVKPQAHATTPSHGAKAPWGASDGSAARAPQTPSPSGSKATLTPIQSTFRSAISTFVGRDAYLNCQPRIIPTVWSEGCSVSYERVTPVSFGEA